MLRFAITLLAGLLAFATPASAQLIVNGSFETPPAPVGGFTNFGGGSTAVTGWTVVGVETALVSGTFVSSGITFQAQSGSQWADLSGASSNSSTNGLRQLVSTVAGQAYELKFYVGSTTGGSFFPATVDLSIDGGPRTSYFNPTGPPTMIDWQLFTVPFTATGATTNLTFFNGSAANNNSTGLDNVSLTAIVPEPSSLALLALPAVSWWIRRRNASLCT